MSSGGLTLIGGPDGIIPGLSQDTRINGTGNSVYLNGQQFFASESSNLVAPSTSGITVSAWISLNLGDLTGHGPVVWPIVSTMTAENPSCGYQLDIRFEDDGTGPKLAFTYAYPDETMGRNCKVIELKRVLHNPSWTWGSGRWMHVAGSYARDTATNEDLIALYSHGNPIGTVTAQASPTALPSISPSPSYVGTSGTGVKTPGAAKYKGYIDDIAIFDRALSDREISDFVKESSTVDGPGGCRWQADEAWDFVNPSTAKLSDPNANGLLTLSAVDRDWGYARLRAHLAPNIDLRETNVACLAATIDPPNTTFEFGLSSSDGDGYCIWWLNQANRRSCGGMSDSDQDSYEIDLTKPNYCQSINCAFSVHSVQEAWIASDWGSAEGCVNLTARGLKFGTSGERTIDYAMAFGGAYGPLGWCWRPQSTNPGASAGWVPDPHAPTRAHLKGPENSTVRLVADFSDGWVDLSRCTTIRTKALIPHVCQYALVLLDIHGAQAQWELTSQTDGFAQYDRLVRAPTWTSNYDDPAKSEFQNMPHFDVSLVRLLGIQKAFGSPCDVEVAITDVRFLGPDGQEDCAVWTCQ